MQMMLGRIMNQFDGELAALQHRRQMENFDASPASAALGKFAGFADQIGIPLAGLFRAALESGQTPIGTMVEQLEAGASNEIARIWMHLEGQDNRQKELAARLKSQEARSAYFSAVLHGLRTSDPKKQARLGALTIHSVYLGDMNPENLDDMLRAAVELKDIDVLFLERICHRGASHEKADEDAILMFEEMFQMWRQLGSSQKASESACRGSLARLQSHSLLYSYYGGGYGSSTQYDLLDEGRKFYERLREIAAE